MPLRAHTPLVTVLVAFLFPLLTAADPTFVEEAALRGVTYVPQFLSSALAGTAGGSQGACFADLDNDGDPDLVLVGRMSGQIGVFENHGDGTFTERSNTGMPLLLKASSISAGDYDADGDLDLFIPQIVYPAALIAPHYLMRNDGNFTFTDVATAAGILPGGTTTGTTWGDYDGDGYVDLYVGNYSWSATPINNRLYHNLGNGTFEEVAEQLGVHDPGGFAFQASFVDYDFDGDVDLHVVNDRGGIGPNPGNALFRNNGDGTFTNVSVSSGAYVEMFSMGLAFGDLDRDGHPDFYVSNIQDNVLLMNAGDGTFDESAFSWGVLVGSVSWGNMLFDMDNDGWLDLYVCNTPLAGVGSLAPALFDCNGTPPCQNIAATAGLIQDTGSYGVASADIDDDGDVDLAVVPPSAPLQLYVNQTNQASRWLKVRLKGAGANKFAVGSLIFVTDAIGQQMRAVVAGHSYKSQSDLVQHFGVGTATSVSEVKIMWPDGSVRTLNNVPTNQTLTVDQNCVPPASVSAPLPANAAANIALPTALSWTGAASSGYTVFFGTASPPPQVGATTAPSWSLPTLNAGTTYYWRIDSGGCETTAGPIWSFTAATAPVAPPNPSAPTVSITMPTATADHTVSDTTTSVSLSGTAADDVAVTGVTWSNARGGSGSCTTQNNWALWTAESVPVLPGDNLITVTAADADGHTSSDALTVHVSSSQSPTTQPPTPAPTPVVGSASALEIAFLAPTDGAAYLATGSPLTLAGTASPGTVAVDWTNNRGGAGVCIGTTVWAAKDVPLMPGANLITISAYDAFGGSGSGQLSVTFGDTAPPEIKISSPTTLGDFETGSAMLNLAGTASDDVGVVSVSWTSSSASGAGEFGDGVWLVEGIGLQPGENHVEVSAADAAGKRGSASLRIVYAAPGAEARADALPPAAPADPAPTADSDGASATSPVTARDARGPSSACGVGLLGLTLSASALGLLRRSTRSPHARLC